MDELDRDFLRAFDWIVVSSSAGKDSQAMLDLIAERARRAGVLDRVVVVHCDLGRVEWKGTRELAEKQAAHYGLPIEIVTRPQGDLLDHVRSRGKWMSSNARYCTSDHKRGQVSKVFTKLADQFRAANGNARRCRILDCMGIRAAESANRSKKQAFSANTRATNGRREVWTYYPIFDWSLEQVWARNEQAGTPHHYAYDLGMPRLSCVFCCFAPKNALLLAGKHNTELLEQYVEIEREIDHDFRTDIRLADILDAVRRGDEVGDIKTWEM